MARRTIAALALALGAALTLGACGEEDLPIDAPSVPDFQESLEELAPDLPTDLGSELQELAPDLSADEVLDHSRDLCQSAADGADEEQLARDAAELFGVEEADGPSLVETIKPYCDVIG
ncbi:hypothetical protein LO763_15700 [Glycomyces sp. A-F 0318]|uniref:hypothetical protein n=1 Tax=Glycomyces amatae TaxID=2881355 RepID=UPI001E41791D|nr:hypothetical protein [Glycomyces amatae]MCD0445061.1 hypothetical protein [Glycomyces amatae]